MQMDHKGALFCCEVLHLPASRAAACVLST
jgi:hypothetical protein